MTKSQSLSTSDTDADKATGSRGSRLISRLLPPAIRLWIQSQVDHIEGLDFRLEAKDRQLLSGYVPRVSVFAHKAVYEGLHISQVQVAATDIRVNLRQVLRGKPLRLLQPFPVDGHVRLSPDDLDASLQSTLLSQGLRDVFQRMVDAQPHGFPDEAAIHKLMTELPTAATVALAADQLTLSWQTQEQDDTRLVLRTRLTTRDSRWLYLSQAAVAIVGHDRTAPQWIDLEDVAIDLGPEVNLKRLTIKTDVIEVEGTVNVIPGDE